MSKYKVNPFRLFRVWLSIRTTPIGQGQTNTINKILDIVDAMSIEERSKRVIKTRFSLYVDLGEGKWIDIWTANKYHSYGHTYESNIGLPTDTCPNARTKIRLEDTIYKLGEEKLTLSMKEIK